MKIVCIVQARMGSERLPGKVMKDLLGKPMIEYTLRRLKQSRYIDEVILATSDKKEDLPLAEYVSEAGFQIFRGDETNVLKRYICANEIYKGDIIIRVTGDCPLIDSKILDNVVTYFMSNKYDYVRLDVPNTFIRGFDVEVFSAEALNRVYEIVKNEYEGSPYKEHVTFYMYKHPKEFKIGLVEGSELYKKDYRLCVDTKEDFKIVETIYSHFGDMYVGAREVVSYLDENPQIANINAEINQKQV